MPPWTRCAEPPATEWAECYPEPVITVIDPAEGEVGETVPVTITGLHFGPESTLRINGVSVTLQNVVVVGPTEITADLVITSGAVLGPRLLRVTTNTGTSAPAAFAVVADTDFLFATFTNGGAAQNLQDYAGTELGGPWTKHPSYAAGGNVVVESAGTISGRLAAPAGYLATGAASADDHEMEADFVRKSTGVNDCGIITRADAAGNHGLLVWYNETLARLEVYQSTGAGFGASLGFFAMALVVNVAQRVRARAQAATLKVYINDVERISLAGLARTTGRRFCVRYHNFFQGSAATGHHLDNVRAFPL